MFIHIIRSVATQKVNFIKNLLDFLLNKKTNDIFLYGKKRVREKPYSGIFYAVIYIKWPKMCLTVDYMCKILGYRARNKNLKTFRCFSSSDVTLNEQAKQKNYSAGGSGGEEPTPRGYCLFGA